jgi:hypothetical protein
MMDEGGGAGDEHRGGPAAKHNERTTAPDFTGWKPVAPGTAYRWVSSGPAVVADCD